MDTLDLSYGKCRFCSTKGNHRDIMKQYVMEGMREVYFDKFQECFNIYLSTSSNKSTLICFPCIKRLQDASDFRALVVRAEQQLLNPLENQTLFVNVGKDVENEELIKCEEVLEIKTENDSIEADAVVDNSDESDFCDYKNDSSEEDTVDGEAEFLARFEPASVKPLPTRNTLYDTCTKFVEHLDVLKGKIITAQSLQKLMTSNTRVYVTEKIAHITNISTILKYSNLTAFKTKRRSGLPCFYCRKVFDNTESLICHQEKDLCKPNIKKLLAKMPSESLVVYVYVTDLKCTLCQKAIPNISELKYHLSRVHKKKLYPEYGDRVIPFKFSKNIYECQICGFNFETFGSIERHMNVHYRNYVCDQCGAGYITKNRLKVHIKYAHVNGVFPCDLCKKVFATHSKYKCHVDAVHKLVKKNKCPKCPERFSDYFKRHKHMVDVHGEPPLRYKCNVCDALFKRRYALSCHIKRRHLELRDIQCALCTYKCYTAPELKVHMIKHNGERTYECTVCKKSYARKKTLKEHMRIHNNDRRYICVVCGQGFVQNCSLKGHMKAHHVDYVNGVSRI